MATRRRHPYPRRHHHPRAAAPPRPAPPPGRPRWPRGWLYLAVAAWLLAPGLAIGALLHVNDILSADLLPGTLFLREAVDVNDTLLEGSPALAAAGSAAAAGVDREGGTARGIGNWSDAFLTMNFHRRMMNEYLCRSYVAEQILGDMTGSEAGAAGGEALSALSGPAGREAAALTSSSSSSAGPAPPGPGGPRRRISSTLVIGAPERRQGVLGLGQQGRNDDDDDSSEEDDRGRRRGGSADAANATVEQAIAPARGPPGAPEPPADEPRGSLLPTFRRKPATPSLATPPANEMSDDTAKPTRRRKRRRRRRRRRRKKRPGSSWPGSRRADAKDSLLADEGSSAYKDWLARTTLLEDIYRHYDHIAQASAASESAAAPDDTATFEGGEVTGFALTHAAHGPGPASFNLPVQHHAVPVQHAVPVHALSPLGLHPGLSLATSINSFAANAPLPAASPAGGLGAGLGQGLGQGLGPGPAPSIGGVGEDRNPFGEFSSGGGGGEFVDHGHEHHHEHQEYEHHEVEKGHHGKVLSLKDLFDLVLTAIAFLAFGAYAIHLIMCLMMIPQNNMMMMTMPPGTGGGDGGGNDNGAGEGEGGRRRRRRRRAAPTLGPGSATPVLPGGVSVEVLNRAAHRVLVSIDAAMLAYRSPRRKAAGRSFGDAGGAAEDFADHRDCLHRALCRHNRYSRTVQGPFRLWMPIWSVGLSWVAGRLSPGTATPAVATLDNLRASLLGLGNARCAVLFPRCSPSRTSAPAAESAGEATVEVAGEAAVEGTNQTAVETAREAAVEAAVEQAAGEAAVQVAPAAEQAPGAAPASTLPSSPPPRAAAGSGIVGIIHPAFSDLPKIITMRPAAAEPAGHSAAAAADSSPQYTAIGIKSSKVKRRRRPGPVAAARKAPRPRRRRPQTAQSAVEG